MGGLKAVNRSEPGGGGDLSRLLIGGAVGPAPVCIQEHPSWPVRVVCVGEADC